MAPTLLPGDYLVTTTGTTPDIGRIVVFSSPRDPAFFLTKRVVAVGPAAVRLDGAVLSIDGSTVDEPWAHGSARRGAWSVGKGELFVLGDDRQASSGDSATVGPIPAAAVHSVVRFRYWPWRRIGMI